MRFSDIKKFWESHLGGQASKGSQSAVGASSSSKKKHERAKKSSFFLSRDRSIKARAVVYESKSSEQKDQAFSHAGRSADAEPYDAQLLAAKGLPAEEKTGAIAPNGFVRSNNRNRFIKRRGSSVSEEVVEGAFPFSVDQAASEYQRSEKCIPSGVKAARSSPERPEAIARVKSNTYSGFVSSVGDLDGGSESRPYLPASSDTNSTSAPASVYSSPRKTADSNHGPMYHLRSNDKFNELQSFWSMKEKKLAKRSVEERRCVVCGCFLNNCIYEQEGALYCEDDFWTKFGHCCKKCEAIITGPIVIAGFRRFHPECFQCECCKQYISDGDLYSLILFKQQQGEEGSRLFCHRCYEGLLSTHPLNDADESVDELKCTVIQVVKYLPTSSPPNPQHLRDQRPQGCSIDFGFQTKCIPSVHQQVTASQQVVCGIDSGSDSPLKVGDILLQVNGLVVDLNALDLIDRLYDQDTGQHLLLTVQRDTLLAADMCFGIELCTHMTGESAVLVEERVSSDCDVLQSKSSSVVVEDQPRVPDAPSKKDEASSSSDQSQDDTYPQHCDAILHSTPLANECSGNASSIPFPLANDLCTPIASNKNDFAVETRLQTLDVLPEVTSSNASGEADEARSFQTPDDRRSINESTQSSAAFTGTSNINGIDAFSGSLAAALLNQLSLDLRDDVTLAKSVATQWSLEDAARDPSSLNRSLTVTARSQRHAFKRKSLTNAQKHENQQLSRSSEVVGSEAARRSNSLRTAPQQVNMRRTSPRRTRNDSPRFVVSMSHQEYDYNTALDLSRSESMRIHGTRMIGCPRVFRPCDLIHGEVLGQGFFGKAMKVTHRDTGEVMVLKVLNSLEEERERSFLKEVKVMRNLSHRNVIHFIGVLYKDGRLNIITEFVENGTVKELLSNMDVELPWKKRIFIARDISSGMSYLHSKNLIHRDLNSANCFVKEDGTVVVADFGLARAHCKTASVGRKKRYTVVGNPYFMAPEMLHDRDYDELVDVFSFGIMLCEVIGRVDADPDFLPRSRDFGLAVVEFHNKFCRHCPAFFFTIAVHCCCFEPSKRPSFKVLEEWFEMLSLREELHSLPEPPHLHEIIVDVYSKYELPLPDDLYHEVSSSSQSSSSGLSTPTLDHSESPSEPDASGCSDLDANMNTLGYPMKDPPIRGTGFFSERSVTGIL